MSDRKPSAVHPHAVKITTRVIVSRRSIIFEVKTQDRRDFLTHVRRKWPLTLSQLQRTLSTSERVDFTRLDAAMQPQQNRFVSTALGHDRSRVIRSNSRRRDRRCLQRPTPTPTDAAPAERVRKMKRLLVSGDVAFVALGQPEEKAIYNGLEAVTGGPVSVCGRN